MPFDEGNKGDPFRGDFPGPPDPAPGDDLAARVHRQVTELAQRRYEPAVRHQRLGLPQRRRRPPPPPESAPEPGAPSPGTGRDGTITQFDFLPVTVGFDTLLASGELLITAQSYDGRPAPPGPPGGGQPEAGPTARAYLDALGMAAGEVDCAELHGRVVRLTHPDMSPQELSDVARELRARGFTASVTNITPTAPIGKGIGGPQPATSPGSRPADPGPGAPAKVAVIDTGIGVRPRTDGWLNDVPRGGNIDPLDSFPLPAGDGYLDIEAGHGTFVAGIIQQIAPTAEITMYRAIDSDGIGGEVAVAREMIQAVSDGAEILNLSLGCQTQDNLPPIAISAALDVIRELERAQDREVLIVAAAGNYADAIPCWPGAFRRVVAVASLTPGMLPSPWSSRGSWVTCSTIGQGQCSTYVEGRESVLFDPDPHDFGPDAWAVWSGTSFAAPQITGALARLHQQHQYPLREALRRLLAAGRPVPDFGQAIKILPGI